MAMDTATSDIRAVEFTPSSDGDARDPDRQTAEIKIRIALLYRLSAHGTPEIVRVG